MVFWPPFALNNAYVGNFKGGVLPLMGLKKGAGPLPPTQFGGSSDSTHAICWVAETNGSQLSNIIDVITFELHW